MSKESITSHDILKILESKHSECVFVSECKDGPTQLANGHSRLDAWVMVKSWAHPCCIGYEIKVSRSDFLGDKKWPAYLPMCNELYFVAPKGIIRPDEMPKEVGLLEVLGKYRAVTRKKAHYRDIQISESVFRYVLMCRSRIKEDEDLLSRRKNGYNQGYWREWLKKKVEDRELGYAVARGVREHVAKVETENNRLIKQHAAYDHLKPLLASMGFNGDDVPVEWSVKRQLERMKTFLPDGVMRDIRGLHRELSDIIKSVEDAEKSQTT